MSRLLCERINDHGLFQVGFCHELVGCSLAYCSWMAERSPSFENNSCHVVCFNAVTRNFESWSFRHYWGAHQADYSSLCLGDYRTHRLFQDREREACQCLRFWNSQLFSLRGKTTCCAQQRRESLFVKVLCHNFDDSNRYPHVAEFECELIGKSGRCEECSSSHPIHSGLHRLFADNRFLVVTCGSGYLLYTSRPHSTNGWLPTTAKEQSRVRHSEDGTEEW